MCREEEEGIKRGRGEGKRGREGEEGREGGGKQGLWRLRLCRLAQTRILILHCLNNSIADKAVSLALTKYYFFYSTDKTRWMESLMGSKQKDEGKISTLG